MSEDKVVKLGIIGLGNIGRKCHLSYIDTVDNVKVTAIADLKPDLLKEVLEERDDEDLKGFNSGDELIAEADLDAIIIATPHYDHPKLAIKAFEKGIHVLTEKPVAVTAYAAQECNAAYEKYKDKVLFAAMFQQRTRRDWMKVKEFIDNGTIGELKRVNWIITDWFRTQAYYNSGGWRATWSGEGGGALINQCPHQLDLIQWFCGMPEEVMSVVGIGQNHEIEVEDEVTAILKYPNGATGVFITSTSESPGTNRLEIVGDKAKLVVEPPMGVFKLIQNDLSSQEHLETTTEGFKKAPSVTYDITLNDDGPSPDHKRITINFINTILGKEELLAPAVEGINGLELGNAMLMSGIKGEPIKIPTPREEFEALIKKMGDESNFVKAEEKKADADMSSSY